MLLRVKGLRYKSHPMWVRGLKLAKRKRAYCHLLSHPMWVRGLKLEKLLIIHARLLSHPMWVRGLKP